MSWDQMVNREPVVLRAEVPKKMRFDAYTFETMPFTDPRTGEEKTAPGIKIHVVEEDGAPVAKFLNVLSKRLATALKAHMEKADYKTRTFTITAHGEGVDTTYTVEVS